MINTRRIPIFYFMPFVAVLLAVALLAGCSDEGPVSPNSEAELSLSGAGLQGHDEVDSALPTSNNTVRFHMKGWNTIEAVPPFPPPVINAIFEGYGKSRPFGPFVVYATSQIDITVSPQAQTTVYVYTFMMGDELHATAVGTSIEDPPGTAAFHGDIIFTGGTGRFSNASGSGTYAGTAVLADLMGYSETDGVISGFGGQGNE
jgi:hypothetical protein